MPSWFIFTLVSIITYSFAIILQRAMLRGEGSRPIVTSIVMQTITGSILLGVTAIMGGLQLPPVAIWPNLLIMMLLYGVGSIFQNHALKHTDASKFTILFATRALFTIAASMLFLGKGLGFLQVLGVVLIFVSVIIATVKQSGFHFTSHDWYVIAAAGCIGSALINDSYILTQMNVYMYNSLAFLLPAFFIAVTHPRDLAYIPRIIHHKGFVLSVITLAVIYAVSALTFFISISRSGDPSKVMVVNLSNILTTIALSALVLKEKQNVTKLLVAAVICIFGLYLVI